MEISQRMLPHIVSLAVLMQDPEDFVRMGNQVGGKFQADEEINLGTVDLL